MKTSMDYRSKDSVMWAMSLAQYYYGILDAMGKQWCPRGHPQEARANGAYRYHGGDKTHQQAQALEAHGRGMREIREKAEKYRDIAFELADAGF